MKKLGSATLAILFSVWFCAPGLGAEIALNGVTGTGHSHWYNALSGGVTRAQVWSAAGSTSTVLVECSSNPLGTPASPAYTVATITNVGTTPVYKTGKCTYVRLNVTAISAGTVYGYLEAEKGLADAGQ